METRAKSPYHHGKSGGVRYASLASAPWRIYSDMDITTIAEIGSPSLLPTSRLQSVATNVRYLTPAVEAEFSLLETLPAEFCLRELVSLDPEDEEDLLGFVQRYGVITSPWFGSYRKFLGSEKIKDKLPSRKSSEDEELSAAFLKSWIDILEEAQAPFDALDGFRGALRDAAWQSDAIRIVLACEGKSAAFTVSRNEAVMSLALLRESVALIAALDVAEGDPRRAVVAMLRMGVRPNAIVGGHRWGEWCDMTAHEILELPSRERKEIVGDILLALRSAKSVGNVFLYLSAMAFETGGVVHGGMRMFLGEWSYKLGPEHGGAKEHVSKRHAETLFGMCEAGAYPEGCLGSAVALQLLAILESDAQWRKCLHQGCERAFKQYRRNDGTAASSRRRQSAFCSQECQQRHKRRAHAAAMRDLDERVDSHAVFLHGRSESELKEWVKNAVAELNVKGEYLAVSDKKMYRNSGFDLEFEPKRPLLGKSDEARALKRLIEAVRDI